MKDYKLILISFVLLIFMIGAVSASDDVNAGIDDTLSVSDDVVVSEGDSIKEIYVSDTGDDSNNGSSSNPYATIGKAISEVTESDEVTIYLSEGTFGSDDDSNFEIMLHHQYNGDAGLKIIGAGANKTFIDGQSASRFAYFGEATRITLKDISFINFKGDSGGAISSLGILNVENCIFKDCYSTSSTGGAISSGLDDMYGFDFILALNVKNSQFISCSVNSAEGWYDYTGGGAIYAGVLDEFILDNNTFINTTVSEEEGRGTAVLSWMSNAEITNNKFINMTGYKQDASLFIDSWMDNSVSLINNTFINCSNPSTDYAIVYLGFSRYTSKNNTFVNSTNSQGNIYLSGFYLDDLNFEMDTTVINVSNNEINSGVKIPCNVSDENGNKLCFAPWAGVTVNLVNENNTYTYGGSGFTDGSIEITFRFVPENGIYNLTISYGDLNSATTSVLTTVNISTLNDPVDLYVSPKGSDAQNGSYEYPFETIQHAIDVGFEKTFNVIVHLLEGTYTGDGNVDLTLANKGSLQLIGEVYNGTIIDGTNANWFYSVSTTSLTVENLSFINGKSDRRTLISGGKIKNCIFDGNTVTTESRYVLTGVLDNVVYTNNYGRVSTSSITNSYFANNKFINLNYGGIITTSGIIENSTFIYNDAKFGGVIYAGDGFVSRNNYYANNNASEINKDKSSSRDMAGVIGTSSTGEFTFINDTFENNYAYESGVIGWNYVNSRTYQSPFYNFTDCKFINNSAVEAGVAKIKAGSFTNCEFINNTADNGGAIALIPIAKDSYTLELNNVIFEGNTAKYNGNDIYLAEKPNYWDSNKDLIYAIDLTINFNDLNTSYLADNFIANVTSVTGAQIGGNTVYFLLNGTNVGTAENMNGIAIFNYAGFEEGNYTLSGYVNYPSNNTIVNNAAVNVKFEDILDNVTLWVSTNGSDENGNGSEANPYKSISYAVYVAGKNSRNIFINIAEGIYTGDLNTGLTLTAINNITLIGAGIGSTIIDGGNTTAFATITEGKNKIVVSDLTIKNMLPDNRVSKILATKSPIVIDEGASLLLNNVEMVDNHGGIAIIKNNGNLEIYNSQFRRNGFTTFGIVCGGNDQNTPTGGNVSIDNSVFEDNYAKTCFMTADNIIVNNSEIKNAYLISDYVSAYELSFAVFNINSYAQGNVVVENTKISNYGSVEALNDLGVTTEGKYVNPALAINGNLNMTNSSMENNYNGTLYTDAQVAAIAYVSVLGYAYGPSRDINVYNSTFVNYQYIWVSNSGLHNFTFDGCLFVNFENLAYSRNYRSDSVYDFTNSAFINCSSLIKTTHFATQPIPTSLNFNDDYWGNNSQPIIYFLGNGGIDERTYSPDRWIILTSEDEKSVIKNLTDGENITAYDGNAPIRTDYADNQGLLDYAVVFGPVGYLFTTDDDKNVIFNLEDAMYPFEAADPMDYRTHSYIGIVGFEGDLIVVGMLVDPVGNPIANATITSTFADLDPVNTTTDENGIFKVKAGKNGVLVSSFAGDDTYFGVEGNLTFTNAGKTTKSFINLNTVDGLVISGNLVDDEGAAIANAKISYVINANKTGNTTTDANGVFSIQGESDAVIDIIFEGSETADAVNATITLKNLAPVRSASSIKAEDYTTSAIDYYAGERGGYFKVQLVDESGAPIANKTVKIGFNGVVYEKPTDENGWAQLQINLAGEGTYTFAVAFLGDDDYNASFVVQKIIVSKKKTSIDASAKSYKASAKTKSYTVTLKTDKGSSVDGKTYLKAGKKVTLKVNGKTYTAKTNAKGQATFKLSITKKGKYSASIKFEGDKTYAASSKTAKITIK